jgi:hypothetical protein
MLYRQLLVCMGVFGWCLVGWTGVRGLHWAAAADAQQAPAMQAVTSPEGVTILEGIRPVLTYQRSLTSKAGRWPRSNYVHPLYDLNGEVITEDFPVDHGHHRGIFWAWHQVLVDDRPMGDAWACVDFQWDVQQLHTETADDSATLKTTTLWKSPALLGDDGLPRAIVKEQATIVVHRAAERLRWIDFTIELWALMDNVRIGGSDDDKGYGGFSPRIKLSDSTRFVGSGGPITPQIQAVSAGPWLDIAGAQGGLLILTQSENPGFPQPWVLRDSRSMQNAAYPGRQPVPLSQTQPLRLRYRLGVYHGKLEASDIDTYQQQYQQVAD